MACCFSCLCCYCSFSGGIHSAVQAMALRGETRDALSIIGWGLVRSIIIMTVAYIIFAITVIN